MALVYCLLSEIMSQSCDSFFSDITRHAILENPSKVGMGCIPANKPVVFS